jgi:hypothetical protein
MLPAAHTEWQRKVWNDGFFLCWQVVWVTDNVKDVACCASLEDAHFFLNKNCGVLLSLGKAWIELAILDK